MSIRLISLYAILIMKWYGVDNMPDSQSQGLVETAFDDDPQGMMVLRHCAKTPVKQAFRQIITFWLQFP